MAQFPRLKPQPRSLEAPRRRAGSSRLEGTVDGSAVAAYKITPPAPRRPWSTPEWPSKAKSPRNQERGKEWEYRVLAVNKAARRTQQHRHGGALNKE